MTNQEKELQTQKFKYIKDKLDIASIMLVLSIIQLFIMKYYYTFLDKKDPLSYTFGSYLILPFIIIVLFNIYFIRIHFLIMQLEPFKDWEIKKALLIWISILSIPRLFLDAAAISDILSEHLTGIWDCSGELKALQVLFYIHLIYYIYFALMLVVCTKYLKKNQDTNIYMYNENNFNRLNYIGFFSGLLGSAATILLTFLNDSIIDWKWIILPFTLLLYSPYFLYLLNWILSIKREDRYKFLDEKQKQDLFKAGITTLLLTLPVLIIYYIFNYNLMSVQGTVLWFPFYLFSSLLFFSGSTIFFYKKK